MRRQDASRGAVLGTVADEDACRCAARVYVCAVIARRRGAAGRSSSRSDVRRQPVALPAAAAALVGHVGLQGEPAARAQRSTMSVSYAVDFASLLLLGPNETMLVAAASAFSQCTFRMQGAQSAATARCSAWRRWSSRCRRPGWRLPLARRHARRCSITLDARQAARRRGDGVLPAQHGAGRDGDRAVDAAADRRRSGTRTSSGARRATSSAPARRRSRRAFVDHGGYWMAPLAAAPLYLTYRTYKVYLGRIEDEQRHVQRDVGPAPGDDRSAGAARSTRRIRRRRSHIRRVQVYAAGLARGARACRENEIQGVKTAALLHDIGKLAVPEHILSKPGPLTQEEFQKIRIHPQVGAEIISGGAVPVSGGAADPEPPRALGRQGLSAGARRARRFRSARASSRSSTTSTR